LFGTSTLTYYVDGAIIGSSAANVYFTAAPECGSQGTVSITKDLGIAKNKTYSYKVLNDSGSEIWEGTHNFEANSCTAIELTF
ncbi:MAG: hypothetical protein R3279_10285, partial [Putridiphycobacter sp.]|nr:hypothetical protein [Putridiphycobacter sp.]